MGCGASTAAEGLQDVSADAIVAAPAPAPVVAAPAPAPAPAPAAFAYRLPDMRTQDEWAKEVAALEAKGVQTGNDAAAAPTIDWGDATSGDLNRIMIARAWPFGVHVLAPPTATAMWARDQDGVLFKTSPIGPEEQHMNVIFPPTTTAFTLYAARPDGVFASQSHETILGSLGMNASIPLCGRWTHVSGEDEFKEKLKAALVASDQAHLAAGIDYFMPSPPRDQILRTSKEFLVMEPVAPDLPDAELWPAKPLGSLVEAYSEKPQFSTRLGGLCELAWSADGSGATVGLKKPLPILNGGQEQRHPEMPWSFAVEVLDDGAVLRYTVSNGKGEAMGMIMYKRA